MNFYKHYLGDYARKTAHLSILQHGAYRLLLDHYYSTLAPLPKDLNVLYRITRAVTEAETEAVTQAVNEFFTLKSDGYHQKRCDCEIKDWTKQAEFNRQVGKLGGRPRKTGRVTEPVTDQEPTPEVRSQKLEARSKSKEKTKPINRRNGEPLNLPDWIPTDPWHAWIEARTQKRNAPTVFAQRLAVAKLDSLRAQGHHPAIVLAQSAFNGWAGLFEPRSEK